MNDTWYDMGFDADMSWIYNWKRKEKKMTREKAENLLNEFLDKHETMMDYERRVDNIVWTQGAEDNATSEYMQLRDKLIDLICRKAESEVNNG